MIAHRLSAFVVLLLMKNVVLIMMMMMVVVVTVIVVMMMIVMVMVRVLVVPSQCPNDDAQRAPQLVWLSEWVSVMGKVVVVMWSRVVL